MNNRDHFFDALKAHPFLGRNFAKLNADAVAVGKAFLEKTRTLSSDDFELALNREFLDPAKRPKKWAILQELLSCANSADRANRKK